MVLGEHGQGPQKEPQKKAREGERKRKCAKKVPFKQDASQNQSVRPVKMPRTEIHIDGKTGQVKKAVIAKSSPENMTMIKDIIKHAVWPWAHMQEEAQLEREIDIIMKSVEHGVPKLDIVLGSSTPDISGDEQSGSDYKPGKSDGNVSSGSWDGIQAKVNEQLAREE